MPIEFLASELMQDPAFEYYREHRDEMEAEMPGIGERLRVIVRMRMEISEACWARALKGVVDMELIMEVEDCPQD